MNIYKIQWYSEPVCEIDASITNDLIRHLFPWVFSEQWNDDHYLTDAANPSICFVHLYILSAEAFDKSWYITLSCELDESHTMRPH